jgi:hypothetical protein
MFYYWRLGISFSFYFFNFFDVRKFQKEIAARRCHQSQAAMGTGDLHIEGGDSLPADTPM